MIYNYITEFNIAYEKMITGSSHFGQYFVYGPQY